MSLYRNILKQALEITWRQKYLWFFGLFAALLGNGGELEVVYRGLEGEASRSVFSGWHSLTATGIFGAEFFSNLGQLLLKQPMAFIFLFGMFLLLLFLFCFLVWLVIVSQAALVYNAANIITSKKHGFKEGLEAGMKKFWPVLSVNIVIKLVVYLIFIALSLPAIVNVGRSGLFATNFLFIAAFLIFVPLAIVASFIAKYAIAYVVIKGSSFLDSIKQGWQLFVKNWLISLEMAFILFFINLIVGILLIFSFMVLAVPFIFLTLLLAKSALYFNLWVIVLLGLIIFLALIVIVGAGLATFQISSWTGLFVELISRGGVSKIVRSLSKPIK